MGQYANLRKSDLGSMAIKTSNALQTTSYPKENLAGKTAVDRSLFLVPYKPRKEVIEQSQRWVQSAAKRVFDVCLALFGLVITLPILAIIAVFIKLTSPGPVLFCQERVGKNRVPFTIYKYRTMYCSTEGTGPTVTRDCDQRTTTVGCALRKLKLDELPQLFNVIRGDMSLVGPRPKLPEHERMEMICRPGITGAATLVFAREETLLTQVPEESFEDFTINVLNPIKANLDKEYAEKSTFLSDLRIIVGTVVGSKTRKPVTSLRELLEEYGNVFHATSTNRPPLKMK